MDPQEIGLELKVGFVLTGRVTQRDTTLIVSSELLDVTAIGSGVSSGDET
jgi:TolB-like protein